MSNICIGHWNNILALNPAVFLGEKLELFFCGGTHCYGDLMYIWRWSIITKLVRSDFLEWNKYWTSHLPSQITVEAGEGCHQKEDKKWEAAAPIRSSHFHMYNECMEGKVGPHALALLPMQPVHWPLTTCSHLCVKWWLFVQVGLLFWNPSQSVVHSAVQMFMDNGLCNRHQVRKQGDQMWSCSSPRCLAYIAGGTHTGMPVWWWNVQLVS